MWREVEMMREVVMRRCKERWSGKVGGDEEGGRDVEGGGDA